MKAANVLSICTSSGVAILALAAAAAKAEDIEATLRVDAVKVYPRTAAVTRRGQVSIPAGEHRLIVRGLPDPVDLGSLRVSAGSRELRLGGVELDEFLTGFHRRVEVGVELDDLAGDLAADLDRTTDGIELAGGGDGLRHFALGDDGGGVFRRAGLGGGAVFVVIVAAAGGGQEDDRKDETGKSHIFGGR